MRILVVTPFYQPAWGYGGIARATTELARELGRAGHHVVVATARWAGSDPLAEEAAGVSVRRFDSPAFLRERLFPWPLGFARFLEQECAKLDIAHIAGHRNGLAGLAAGALRRARVPYVVQPHGTYPHHGAHQALKRIVDVAFGDALIRRASRLIAVSQAEAADLPRAASVVPNGVSEVGAATGRRGDARGLLFVGSDAPQKRGHVLLDLLASLPDTELSLIGRFGPAFRQRFARFGNRVSFGGVLAGDALARAYAGARLLVQPAVGEAFGLAAFEASLAGTAAVVAGGHGCGEWLGRAGGCVVPPGDTTAFVEAIRRRLEEPALAEREAGSVAAFARSELLWPKVAGRLAELYAAVLSEA